MFFAILYAVAFILEANLALYYFGKKYNRRYSVYRTFGCCYACYALMFLLSLLYQPILNIIVFVIFNAIIAHRCFYSSGKSAFIYALLFTGALIISDVIAGLMLEAIYGKFELRDMKASFIILYLILCKTLYMMLIFITAQVFSIKYKLRERAAPFFIPVIMMLASILIVISYYYVSNKIYITRECEVVIVACSSIVMVISAASILLYENLLNSADEVANLQQEMLLEKDKQIMHEKLLESYDNQKIIIHDIKKHLNTIREYAYASDYNEVTKYVDKLIGLPVLNVKHYYSKSAHLNNVLGQYETICNAKNIDFGVDIAFEDIDCLQPDDMTALFGNLLDNAVEASEGSDGALIELIIRERNSCLALCIKNTCLERVNIEAADQGISTKLDKVNHGIGLKSVKKVTKKYNGIMNFYYDESSKMFIVNIELKFDRRTKNEDSYL